MKVIASTVFGIEINSFENPDNEFQKIAKKMTNFSNWKFALKFLGLLCFPSIMSFFKVKLLGADIDKFFQNTVVDNIKYREEHGIIRNDMIHLLMQAKKGKLKIPGEEKEENIEGFSTVHEADLGIEIKSKWSDDEIAAQAFLFFLAGFGTVSFSIFDPLTFHISIS